MEVGQRIQTGAHAQKPGTVYKVLRNVLGPAPILPQPTAETSVPEVQKKKRAAPRKQKDAQVSCSFACLTIFYLYYLHQAAS